MEFFVGAIIIYILYKLITRNSKSKTSNSYNSPQNNKVSKPSVQKSDAYGTQAISVSSYNENDEEFATFTIHTSFGREAEKSSNKQKGRWIGESEQLTIIGRNINKGLFYFGGIMNSLDGYGVEPSLIDEERPASKPLINIGSELHTDETLGYWPSYSSLSKECRGAYLDWLASDRSDPNTPIGYVFIYFYGFERRIIENQTSSQVSDQEFTTIFEEILRLHKVFNTNRSFRGYSANFLELMALLRPTLLEQRIAKIPDTNNALSFKLKLAKTVVNGQPVGPELALDWLKDTFEYSLKTPARRCEKEFRELFEIRFSQKFGKGISVKPNKTKLRLSYHAASNGINGIDLNLEELPDPSILKGPINKLIPIAEQCTEELSSYSRYLGKADTSKNDIAALMLLPKELANESNSSVIESFKSWAVQVVQNNNGVTTVKEFWSHTGIPLPKSMNKKENELLIKLAAKADIGIAPDMRFHQTKFKADGNIVLFSPGHGEFFEPSSAFNQVSLWMRLGAMVATIDGIVDQDEKLALQKLIEHDDRLSPSEKSSLNAYLMWRLNSPANTAGLKARIEQLNSPQIESLKKFMISIALADGKVDSSEIKQMEKLYTCLGLDKSLVTSDIHNLASTRTPNSSYPTNTDESGGKFQLDEDILAMHESDTSDAKSMLESIFTVDIEPEIETMSSFSAGYDGLDNEHKNLFDMLLSKEIWPRNEFHELCKKLNLMVDGAIETINDWAYEKVDAPVLDDDGDIYVDLEIVKELKG
ncbi:TerB N-terminal domain-containing protein [Vibrio parahaemolyticus]|uniref:tellurite resistance TerB family protein n=1 Tax=Vibrio parahaemolyticus TaxID=670 RepID=UPI000411F5BF|nr:TerB N-terminal domain-containing protein [Vibrio parahaemolyticus]MDF4974427.1 TerB N-terminal domain-containing protein [Vibrio parahaemolyticus]MDF5036917.1 TerB N-terminal domain-containing protein [Vibrio parahaemolyticus]MDF5221257.1 TerB N-terminal domain-containing protein [Vibrio parahaemolyticus]MDF5686548.1 TerB N-terminal domain-containing protein [Vibrio parahaemolyticus]MEA5295495.1 TerB N-terminal domain-containing protein [Vibrio parahaemolyticus]